MAHGADRQSGLETVGYALSPERLRAALGESGDALATAADNAPWNVKMQFIAGKRLFESASLKRALPFLQRAFIGDNEEDARMLAGIAFLEASPGDAKRALTALISYDLTRAGDQHIDRLIHGFQRLGHQQAFFDSLLTNRRKPPVGRANWLIRNDPSLNLYPWCECAAICALDLGNFQTALDTRIACFASGRAYACPAVRLAIEHDLLARQFGVAGHDCAHPMDVMERWSSAKTEAAIIRWRTGEETLEDAEASCTGESDFPLWDYYRGVYCLTVGDHDGARSALRIAAINLDHCSEGWTAQALIDWYGCQSPKQLARLPKAPTSAAAAPTPVSNF